MDTNVHWLIPNRLAGRPGPNREPWNLRHLREAGFSHVVSVTERMVNKSAEFSKYDLRHVCIPLPSNVPPSPGDEYAIGLILPLITQIVRNLLKTSEATVLVHCSSGKDRTALVLIYLLVEAGMSNEEALDIVHGLVPNMLTAEGWRPMADRLLEQATARDGNRPDPDWLDLVRRDR